MTGSENTQGLGAIQEESDLELEQSSVEINSESADSMLEEYLAKGGADNLDANTPNDQVGGG